MKQTFTEANSDSSSEKIPRPLWNPKFHYRVHNSPLLVLIQSHVYPVHNFTPYFPKIHSNTKLLTKSSNVRGSGNYTFTLALKILLFEI